MNDNVTLRVDGREWNGWTSVRIGAGIERLARDFSVEITRQWPGDEGITTLQPRIKNGSKVEVLIGDELVITGWVEATPVRYDARSVSTGKEVPGITRAWTYRHWMGTGTVGVMIASSDLINPIPEESTETAARQHIGPLAPVAGSDLYVFRPVAHTVDFHIRVTPDTPEIRAAITAELRSFLLRDGYPQGELKVSRISEAISGANGEYSHQLLAPADNITIAKNELAVLGAISWT